MLSKIVALVGPTASGKSALALELADSFTNSGIPVEIVNGDAMQLYSDMNIGTAKLSAGERMGVTHHLFDVIRPDQEMTAVEYQSRARATFVEIRDRGAVPLLVGGSMFYISAALDVLDFAPTDPAIRAALELEAEDIGSGLLFERLKELDPETASVIPKQNVRRVIRALEVIQITGEPYSNSLPSPRYVSPTIAIGLDVERETLKQRIALRVQQMWAAGLLEEARSLRERYSLSRTAAKAIGYAQAFDQLDGKLSEQQAQEQTIQLTNRYARRQMSWFRRDSRIHWISAQEDLTTEALRRIRLEQ